jgi:cytochrome c553
MTHDPTPDRDAAADRREDRLWTIRGATVVGGFLAFSAFVAFVALPIAQAPAAGIDAWTAICRAVGVSPGTPAGPQPTSNAQAQPVSKVSWSPRTLDILAAADPRPGAQLAAAVCSACHGEQGVSPSGAFPHLAGQSAAAIYKQLNDYKSGARVNASMTPVAQQLTNDQLAAVAAYFARDNAFGSLGARGAVPDEDTAKLVHRGDPSRGIPACNGCHGGGVGGPIETPTLTGQHQEYLAAQLKLYRSGERRNDVYRRMREIASGLTDQEIEHLALYYQGLR